MSLEDNRWFVTEWQNNPFKAKLSGAKQSKMIK